MLVVDAGVVLAACAAPDGFAYFGPERLTSPALMWSEARSALHEALWRREISRDLALKTLSSLHSAPINAHDPKTPGEAAWKLAEEFGWAKTYDAEYVALAQMLGCRLVTLDLRLRRGADRLGLVVTPDEL